MKNKQITAILIIYGLIVIPLVHYVAPMFFSETPEYVATQGGSIIGQTNVYAQLVPYAIAWLSAPVALLWALVRVLKKK